MKTIFTSLVTLCIFNSLLFSQITIGQSDMPNSGDTIRVSFANNFSANPDSVGANYTWNYSNLIPSYQNLEKFVSPLTTAYPLPFAFTASYGQYAYTPDSVFALIPTDVYNFFKESSTQFKQVGIGMTLFGLPLPLIFSSNDIVYNFPLQIGDSDSCTAGYGVPIPNLFYYGQTIKRKNIADGWGTVITPYGTYQALRVKSILNITDTIYFDTLNFGFSIPRPEAYEYKWLATGKKIPVLQVNASDVLGNPVVNNVWYQDTMQSVPQVGIDEILNSSSINIYPNPAADFTCIEFSLSVPGEVTIEVFDFTGKKVYENYSKKDPAGNNKVFLYLNENYTSGIYLVKITTQNQTAVKKLVLTK